MAENRLSMLPENTPAATISELTRERDELRARQYAGGGNIVGYMNTTSNVYDIHDSGAVFYYVSLVPDRQYEAVARINLVVHLDTPDGIVWTKAMRLTENFDVQIYELADYINTWEINFIPDGGPRNYYAKVYITASDSGEIIV